MLLTSGLRMNERKRAFYGRMNEKQCEGEKEEMKNKRLKRSAHTRMMCAIKKKLRAYREY